MSKSNNFLANFVDLEPIGANSRTARRWLNELNGAAYSRATTRILIHLPSLREWFRGCGTGAPQREMRIPRDLQTGRGRE